MNQRTVALRGLHDLGAAVWFGGTLMGAVGLNGAARAEGSDPAGIARIAGAGWRRWAPVGAVGLGMHLAGGAGLLAANASRLRRQECMAATTAAKALVTAAALAASVCARELGRTVGEAAARPQDPEGTGGHRPDPDTARRLLMVVQWVVPVLTGTVVVLGALQGEQQVAAERRSASLRNLLPRG